MITPTFQFDEVVSLGDIYAYILDWQISETASPDNFGEEQGEAVGEMITDEATIAITLYNNNP